MRNIFIFVDVYGTPTQPYVPILIEKFRKHFNTVVVKSVSKPLIRCDGVDYLKKRPSLKTCVWAFGYLYKNYSFYKGKGSIKSLIRRIAELRDVLMNNKAIIHIYHSQKTPYIAQICKPSVYDYYVTFHGFDTFVRPFNDAKWKLELQQIYTYSKGLIYVSEPMKQFAIKELGAPAEKCFVSSGGVQVNVQKTKKEEDVCKFGTIGRMVWEKGYVYTLLAIKKLVEKTDLKFEYHIIGDGIDHKAIQYLIRTYKLEKNVILHGFVENQKAKELINECNVYTQFSLSESSSLTLKEAGMIGLPLIGTKVGGIPETIIDGYTGTLVEVGDIEAMTNTMYEYLIDPVLRQERGRNAKKHCLKYFSVDNEFERIVDIYTKNS